MFQSSGERLRAWLSRLDDILGGAESAPEQQLHLDHPHRQALRWRHTRRAGEVPAPYAHCLSPIRAARGVAGRGQAARS